MAGPTPGVRRRLLVQELVRLREEAGLEFEHIVGELGFSKSKMSRIEAGRIGVSIVDAKALAQVYGADNETLARVDRYARMAKQRGLSNVYANALESWFSEFMVLETEAVGVDTFEIDLIPGLFQTPAYIRWIGRAYSPEVADDVIEKRVELRQARQRKVEDGSFPVWAIIDEAALRRAVGGATVHKEQLTHLAKLAELPNVTLQVLPFASGQHIAMGTAFIRLKFADYPTVVYVESMTGGLFLEDPASVERYTLAFDHLRASALDPRGSVRFVKRVIAELATGP
jgi:transcriptional regulator with XRE-family HTH domain